MANVPIRQIFGTAQTVFDMASDIASANFSAAGTTFDNTTDAAVPYATHAVVMAEFPDWAAAPTAGSVVELWGVLIDTDGTDDDTDAPSGTASNGARYFGTFVLDDADALQRRTITISLEGVQKFAPYLRNLSGQNMNNDGGTNCVVKITPFAYGVNV